MEASINNFGTYLDQTGYEAEIKKLTCQDSILGCSPFNIPWSTIGWIGLGMVGFVMLTSGGPRRYGR